MTDLQLTEEQIHAIKTAHSGETFVVDAVAGSGKTTTARRMCQALSGNTLYLTYNTAAAADARQTFPPSVKVSTTSALAWAKFEDVYGDRILGPKNERGERVGAPRVPARETARLAGIVDPVQLGPGTPSIQPITLARLATDTIQRFCYSADKVITVKHAPPMPMSLSPLQSDVVREAVIHYSRAIWRDSTLNHRSKHWFTFDHAFKLLIMNQPDLGYDTVIIDEAQDSNDATMHLLQAQYDSQLIAIGDPAQQLYAWRGASDIMGEFDGPRLGLSKSFRFGPDIAEEANKWLPHTETHIRVTGNENMNSVVSVGGINKPDAVLCRTNFTVMAYAMQYLEEGRKVAVGGGTKPLETLARAAFDLRQGKPTLHPELAAFNDWADLIAYTTEPGGGDLRPLVTLVQEHGIPDILRACKMLVNENYGDPDIVISTAHKAKGREWSRVVVADDFKEPQDVVDLDTGRSEPAPIDPHSAMLHYVTVTRARHHLDRGGLAWIDRHPAPKDVRP
jgi:hypothetical protein